MKAKITIGCLSVILLSSIVLLVVARKAEAAADWVGIDSSHLLAGGAGVGYCGQVTGNTVANALDGDDSWLHGTDHTHWFILDLGQEYSVQKMRGRSNSSGDPNDVNIYVSNDTGNWGAAVASGITTWLDTANWVEVDNTDKNGRYIKVEIVSTEHPTVPNMINFGPSSGGFTIVDVYGEATAPPPQVVMININ